MGELQDQLRRLTIAHQNCEHMLVRMVEGRNEAWHREDIARARVHELEIYVEDLDEYYTNLHEEVHRPVEALSERVSNQGSRHAMVTTDLTMDIAQQTLPPFDRDAAL